MPTRRAQADPETLRKRAIEEATKLLAEGGPDQVKARLIAVRLGLSVGTIYNLFGQLDELLFHANGLVYDQLLKAVSEAAAGASGDEAAIALSHAYLRFIAENEALWAGVLAFNRRSKTAAPEWYREKERALLDLAEKVVADAAPDADSAKRALAARTLWAAVHGIVTISIGRDGMQAAESDIRDQIDLVAYAVLKDLKVPR